MTSNEIFRDLRTQAINDIRDSIKYLQMRIDDIDNALDNNDYDKALDMTDYVGLRDIDFKVMVLKKLIKKEEETND